MLWLKHCYRRAVVQYTGGAEYQDAIFPLPRRKYSHYAGSQPYVRQCHGCPPCVDQIPQLRQKWIEEKSGDENTISDCPKPFSCSLNLWTGQKVTKISAFLKTTHDWTFQIHVVEEGKVRLSLLGFALKTDKNTGLQLGFLWCLENSFLFCWASTAVDLHLSSFHSRK